MNRKNHIPVVIFIQKVLKTFLTKVSQNPDYYYSKHYCRIKQKNRDERIW
ncbi:MAG TPA: hypothetical protein VN722_00355 [Hanamia sp.]|nr:hypothetical protein [Hanamia sp.]